MTAKCQRGYDFKNHESLCAAFNLALLKAGKVLVEKREGIMAFLTFWSSVIILVITLVRDTDG